MELSTSKIIMFRRKETLKHLGSKKKSNFKKFSVENAFLELRTHFCKSNFLKFVKISKILKMSWEWF